MLEVTFSESHHVTLLERFKSHSIIQIAYHLEIGDIKHNVRKEAFLKLFSHVPFTQKEIDEVFDRQHAYHKTLLQSAQNHEKIRIWIDNTPQSQCGFAYLCFLLKDIDCELVTVILPKYESHLNHIAIHNGWHEVAMIELVDEQSVHPLYKTHMANTWVQLVQENAPLRVLINGKIMSVPEDFYDFLLEKWVPDTEFTMAGLIGSVIGNECPGLVDAWLYSRIQTMIENNKLKIIKKTVSLDSPYSTILKKK